MKHRRTIKLILPGLQLKLILAFLFLSALLLALQYILLMSVLAQTAAELPHDGLLLFDRLGSILRYVFTISASVLLPLTFLVGLVATHRLAGPIYRLQGFLRQVIAGERPPDCKLRKGDELVEMCTLINQATATARAMDAKPQESVDASPGLRAAG